MKGTIQKRSKYKYTYYQNTHTLQNPHMCGFCNVCKVTYVIFSPVSVSESLLKHHIPSYFSIVSSLLTLILLTWRIGWALNNAKKWQMGFNSAFEGFTWSQFVHKWNKTSYYIMRVVCDWAFGWVIESHRFSSWSGSFFCWNTHQSFMLFFTPVLPRSHYSWMCDVTVKIQ